MRKVCVITGGYGGMGHASALSLGEEYSLLVSGRDVAKLESEVRELTRLGFDVEGVRADVRDEQDVRSLASRAQALGEVACVIHTAGESPADSVATDIVSTNAVGTVNMVKSFSPVLSEGGVMINFASMAAYSMEPTQEWLDAFAQWDSPAFFDAMMGQVGEDDGCEDSFFRDGIAYSLSKRFVLYFTQMNTERFAHRGCRILSISPGCYLTPMHEKLIANQPDVAENQLELIPEGRWGHPYEIGSLVRFLCDPAAAYITGVDILADGGSTAEVFVPQIES